MTFHIKDNGYDKAMTHDLWSWKETKDSIIRRKVPKKYKPIIIEGILGGKVAKAFNCTNPNCEAMKFVGKPVRPTQNKTLSIRSIKYSSHDCITEMEVETTIVVDEEVDAEKEEGEAEKEKGEAEKEEVEGGKKEVEAEKEEVEPEKEEVETQIDAGQETELPLQDCQEISFDNNIPSVDFEFGKIRITGSEDSAFRKSGFSRGNPGKKKKIKYYLNPAQIRVELEEDHPVKVNTMVSQSPGNAMFSGSDKKRFKQSQELTESILFENFKSCELGKVSKSMN